MNTLLGLAGLLAVGLAIYLADALLRPGRFG